MSDMRDNVERLIDSGISAYRVSKATGIPNNTVVRIFSGKTKIDSVRFKVIETLSEFYEKEKKNLYNNERRI